MNKNKQAQGISLVSFKNVANKIFEIRGQTVMLDSDLAEIYGTSTKALNQAVKRNQERFPEDFMFKLTKDELSKVVTICDHLGDLKFSYQLPFVFTEHGALMLASVLKSDIAVHASLEIVRAFVKMRSMILANKDLTKKINLLETKLTEHDKNFKIVFDAIRSLMEVDSKGTRKPIGFHVNMKSNQKLSKKTKVSRKAKT
jgi:hypothetical protein